MVVARAGVMDGVGRLLQLAPPPEIHLRGGDQEHVS